MELIANPAAYFSEIVLPTVREFLADRGDRRRAYLACIAAFHLCDYVSEAEGEKLKKVQDAVRLACEPSFLVLQGVCNGSKHGAPSKRGFKFTAGSERDVPVFGFDMPGAGYDQGRYDVAGLEVCHQGQKLFVDWCLQVFILSIAKLYPAHFAGADFSWVDGAFRCAPQT